MEAFLEVGLFYLSLRARTFLNFFFEKMQLILLRWFAVQQQTIRLRQKTFGSFYLKFSTKFYELSLFF